MTRDYSRWLEDTNNPDVKGFVESGGYGEFKGWLGSGPSRGFMTGNGQIPNRGFSRLPVEGARSYLPPDRSYFADGKYHAIDGTDRRLIPPGYELIGIDEPYTEGDVGSQTTTPGRMILKRKEPPAAPAAPAAAAAPAPQAAPQAPAPRIDASTPSLADALKNQNSQRPALQGALDSALQLNGWRDAGRGEDPVPQHSRDGESGRRFAASDRWRQRLAEATGRLNQPMA